MMKNEKNLPISTEWLLDSIGQTGRGLISDVFMVYCPKTHSKGTGFLYKSGYVITNWHVINDCSEKEIILISNKGEEIKVLELISDKDIDLAALKPEKKLQGGLEIDNSSEIKPGVQISTWGHPLEYPGPAPLLSVGYISGFRDHYETKTSQMIKHIVVNGAFNPGNSGGPLFISGEKKVIGVVVSKHAPMNSFLNSALEALSKTKGGFVYTATDGEGNKKEFMEAHLVAELLKHQRKLTQVMIGEAIDRSELINFLKKNNIE
ncbi:MAG: trypsin-like peptidase domain-containing protein [Candidatus Pacearchaeota archaeon]|nr:MAG: trypsin-like peptidase domain-containing protein [Candidatus Pacearchaeota archaeon]